MTFTIPTIYEAVDKMSATIKKIGQGIKNFVRSSEAEVAKFERRFRSLGNTAKEVAQKTAIVGLALAAPLILAAHNAIAFEDRMADVSKTTGITGKNLDKLGKGILDLAPATRTSIEELQQIAAIGGSMAVAERDLLSFTDSVNKFNVALGADFGGVETASRAISGLKTLFKETRDINVAEAITKTGSAINALSAKGVVVPEITEFIARVGQLPDAIKPSIQNTAALAAVFNKAGITAEIGARAFGDILLTAAQNLPKFAKQMGVSRTEATKLINTDPTAFAVKFAKSLNGLSAEKLAKTLKALKLTDAGAIKAVGALSSSTKIMAEFQQIANDEFKKGTSLLNEYNTKNETTAAKVAKAKNSFEAFSIILGQELLPVINSLLIKLIPTIKSFGEWAQKNPGTIRTVLMLTAAVAGLSFVVSGISSVIYVFSQIMLLWAFRTKLITAAQWLLNVALTANPIGVIIVAIAALIALIIVAVKYYNEWGAALLFLIGPLGWVVNLIQSFRRNWDMIKESFSKGGIIGGLKAIGAVILDAILMPLQQILKIIANITGFDWAKNAVDTIESMRKNLGVNVTTDESGNPIQPKATVNPELSRQEVLQETIKTSQSNIKLDIADKTGRASVTENSGGVPVKLSSTM